MLLTLSKFQRNLEVWTNKMHLRYLPVLVDRIPTVGTTKQPEVEEQLAEKKSGENHLPRLPEVLYATAPIF